MNQATRSPTGQPKRDTSEGTALDVLIPGELPVRPAVAVLHPLLGALHDDRVADVGHAVEPLREVEGDVDAAVRDVASALVADRPGGGVDVLAAPRDALRELDLGAVAVRGVDGHAVGGGV